MKTCTLRRAFVTYAPALLALTLAVHMLATFVYLTPLNPIKLRIAPWLYRYMHPVFQQDWRLFTPNPVKDTRVLMVSCRLSTGDGRAVETDWTDITTPYWRTHYRNRFSPADRIARSATNASRMSYTTDPETIRIRERRPPDNEIYDEVLKKLEAQEIQNHSVGLAVLNRIASAHCSEFFGSQNVQAVRVRIAVFTFPRFSDRRRSDANGSAEYFDYEWAPRQRVAPLKSGHGKP